MKQRDPVPIFYWSQGTFFTGSRWSVSWRSWIIDFRSWRMPRLFIVAGNHDYIGNQSFYKDFEWADNVVFSGRITYLMFIFSHWIWLYMEWVMTDRRSRRLCMTAQTDAKISWRQALPDGCRHILLAHGGDSSHIPINQEKLRQAGFDYIDVGT